MKPIIKTDPQFYSPITFRCALIGVTSEIAHQRVREAWIDPKITRPYGVTTSMPRVNTRYVEIELPQLKIKVYKPLQSHPELTTVVGLGTRVYFLPAHWVGSVISKVPAGEIPNSVLIEYLMRYGFVLRVGEEIG